MTVDININIELGGGTKSFISGLLANIRNCAPERVAESKALQPSAGGGAGTGKEEDENAGEPFEKSPAEAETPEKAKAEAPAKAEAETPEKAEAERPEKAEADAPEKAEAERPEKAEAEDAPDAGAERSSAGEPEKGDAPLSDNDLKYFMDLTYCKLAGNDWRDSKDPDVKAIRMGCKEAFRKIATALWRRDPMDPTAQTKPTELPAAKRAEFVKQLGNISVGLRASGKPEVIWEPF